MNKINSIVHSVHNKSEKNQNSFIIMGFEFINETNLQKRAELIDKAFAYLDEFKEKDCESLLQDQGAYEALMYISHTSAYYTNHLDINIYLNKGLEIIYGKILTFLNELSKNGEQFVIETTEINVPKKDLSFNQKCSVIFGIIIYSINIIASRNQVKKI
jgi:hypothetical protein